VQPGDRPPPTHHVQLLVGGGKVDGCTRAIVLQGQPANVQQVGHCGQQFDVRLCRPGSSGGEAQMRRDWPCCSASRREQEFRPHLGNKVGVGVHDLGQLLGVTQPYLHLHTFWKCVCQQRGVR